MLDGKPFWSLQPLNLGTLVGVGIAACLSKYFPALCPALCDRVQLIIYGGLVGSTIYKSLRLAMSNLFKFVSDYLRLFEAHVFLRANLMDDREFHTVLHYLVNKHFGVNQSSR